jgi:hypothetical protein
MTWTRTSLLREIVAGGKPAAELLDDRVFENLSLAGLVAEGDKVFVNSRRNNYYYGRGGVAVSSDGVAAPQKPEDVSDRLMVFDLSGKKLNQVYDAPTRMQNIQLMGVNGGRLFANLQGDGILILDVRNPAKPAGLHFARTLGYATHIEFAGDDAYVASGYFGITHIDLAAKASLGVE